MKERDKLEKIDEEAKAHFYLHIKDLGTNMNKPFLYH
jgi:hypothetical protein